MRTSRGLGKGLDALIPPSDAQEDRTTFLCPVDAISPHPDQPRQSFDPQKMEELVRTVREKGILSPVIVRSLGSGYQLISGERRWRAAKLAGLERIPAMAREVSDREALELSLIENIQREDLKPLEESRGYQALLQLHGGTQEELAQRVGKDRSTVANSLRLLKLPLPAQKALEDGLITPGHARCLLSIPPDFQESLLREILAKNLSVRAAERLAKGAAGSPRRASRAHPASSVHVEEIRARLRALLGTQVRIMEGKRRGKIVIEYYGVEDLNRITQLVMSIGTRLPP
jgi:ParB family chromosome partitioning protein